MVNLAGHRTRTLTRIVTRTGIEQVLQVIDGRPEITRLVVGMRKRSAIGKAVLGSIPQRLILEATVPVL